MPKDRFQQLSWRPRVPSLLPKEKEEEIKKNLKEYSKKYEEEDEALLLQVWCQLCCVAWHPLDYFFFIKLYVWYGRGDQVLLLHLCFQLLVFLGFFLLNRGLVFFGFGACGVLRMMRHCCYRFGLLACLTSHCYNLPAECEQGKAVFASVGLFAWRRGCSCNLQFLSASNALAALAVCHMPAYAYAMAACHDSIASRRMIYLYLQDVDTLIVVHCSTILSGVLSKCLSMAYLFCRYAC